MLNNPTLMRTDCRSPPRRPTIAAARLKLPIAGTGKGTWIPGQGMGLRGRISKDGRDETWLACSAFRSGQRDMRRSQDGGHMKTTAWFVALLCTLAAPRMAPAADAKGKIIGFSVFDMQY